MPGALATLAWPINRHGIRCTYAQVLRTENLVLRTPYDITHLTAVYCTRYMWPMRPGLLHPPAEQNLFCCRCHSLSRHGGRRRPGPEVHAAAVPAGSRDADARHLC